MYTYGRFVSSVPTHCWVSYSNLTYATLANSAYVWFLAHAISVVGTRSLQPEKTQRTTVNSRHTALRAQSFSRTYCCWRCVRNVRVSNLSTLSPPVLTVWKKYTYHRRGSAAHRCVDGESDGARACFPFALSPAGSNFKLSPSAHQRAAKTR